MDIRYISYLRVSTDKQGERGLGVDAQRKIVNDYLNGGELIAEYVEVESGKKNNRPKIAEALAHAKRTKSVLLIAKLDRLARNVAFIANLMESKVKFIACDMPNAQDFQLHIYAALAQQEGKMISERTKAALAALKARGVKLGGIRTVKDGDGIETNIDRSIATRQRQADTFAATVGHSIRAMRERGLSLRACACQLSADRVETPRGGQWTAMMVKNVLDRLSD